MTLVDKLEGVHFGDLILLKPTEAVYEQSDRVGYVTDYTAETVTLSNTSLIRTDGYMRSMKKGNLFQKEEVVKFHLKDFSSYEILKEILKRAK